jgi:hypothetical protein
MEIAGWFICGFIAAFINYKTEEMLRKIIYEFLLFICGYIGLLFIVYRWIKNLYVYSNSY